MSACLRNFTICAALLLTGCVVMPAYDGYGYSYPAYGAYPYEPYYPAYPYGPYYNYGWWPGFYGGAVFFSGGGHGGGRHGGRGGRGR
ncbi:hypothetical protein RA280_26520 [Cupriavidus sp. CV2]|uniref:hypothetical protein n=1 Tax=Cupriavidus ulmosensis TaxID=3065913 RepID=UPI00296B4F0C|nr:hypothetical protein [Cupriavidus sp. CV2]MDW3685234.1 hypothetical protein [Cupriavidus sp. CV2]